MTHTVFCQKLQEELPAQAFQSWPGELGERIFANISAQAWQMWLSHQTILVNEYRLNPMDAEAKAMLIGEMEKFLFGEGSEAPAEYVPEK